MKKRMDSPLALPGLHTAIKEQGILIDNRILATTEDVMSAMLLTFNMWVEFATRCTASDIINLTEPWEIPHGYKTFSHWYCWNYRDVALVFENSISRARCSSAVKYLVQHLEVLEQRNCKGEWPRQIEYRLNFEKLAIWFNLPRPEDLKLFQRSRPPTGNYLLPQINPRTGKIDSWHRRNKKLPRVKSQGGKV